MPPVARITARASAAPTPSRVPSPITCRFTPQTGPGRRRPSGSGLRGEPARDRRGHSGWCRGGTRPARSEGALLRDSGGVRLMPQVRPRAELGPRDVVAHAIVRRMAATGADHVLLDARHLGADFVRGRFPTIHRRLLAEGIDLATDLVPVAPAHHFHSGGVLTDLFGRAGIEGLYAAGEAACTGVHGANRLASNSLLEGLVFAHRAAHD